MMLNAVHTCFELDLLDNQSRSCKGPCKLNQHTQNLSCSCCSRAVWRCLARGVLRCLEKSEVCRSSETVRADLKQRQTRALASGEVKRKCCRTLKSNLLELGARVFGDTRRRDCRTKCNISELEKCLEMFGGMQQITECNKKSHMP